MSRLSQDNINCHMCHMIMSLKGQTHFHTIRNFWVITPHGATQQFGMLILVHEKTSAPPPGHLTPLPCLLSRLSGFCLPPPDETLTLPPHLHPTTPVRCGYETLIKNQVLFLSSKLV
ncbi:hypothetical protein O181_103212 [Austropuccinia psidii MF-1]|uniref:Uncharacterized protein n=1 Tax=Austropuccinia psidii MF-1 TaxID=1389203 RepID=A0A9Q3PK83_9BASI|nr:hypothetical protein [Austropuccinia psidii MF-1]